MKDHSKSYQIRNKYHEIEGTYTEEELLQRITNGKYTGSEQVAQLDSLQWQKISSHPVFYDAFLKRLYHEQYHYPSDAQKAAFASQAAAREQATRRGELTAKLPHHSAENIDHLAAGTERLEVSPNASEEGTFQQVEIEKLFRDEFQNPNEVEQREQPPKKDVPNPMEVPLVEGENLDEHSFAEAMPPADPEPELRRREVTVQGKSRSNGLVLVGGVLLILLVMLFQMGQGPVSQSPTGPVIEETRKFLTLMDGENLSSQSRQEVINALLDEGQSFYWMDTPLHYQGALSVFREAAALSGKDPLIQAKIALAAAHLLEQNSKNPEFIVIMKAAIALGRETEPHLSAFYRAEAIADFFQKNIPDAKQKLLAAQESDPSDGENQLLAAELLASTGDVAEAKQIILQAIPGLRENVRAHYVAAVILLDSGDTNEAKNEVEEVIKLNPLHGNSYSTLAEILQKMGQNNEAKIFFDLTTKLAPLSLNRVVADSQFSIAKLFEAEGNSAEAEKRLKLAWYYSRGDLPGLSQKIKGVRADEAQLRVLASESVYDKNYYENRGQELLQENNPELAIKFFQTLRLLNQEDAAPLIKVGDVLEKLAISYEDLRRVMLVYQRAIEKDPNAIGAYLKLGSIETEQYELEKGYRRILQAAAILGYDEIDAFVNRQCKTPRLDIKSGNDNAKAGYEVFVSLGKHFYKREDYDCAREFFSHAASLNSSDSQLYYFYGLLARVYKKDMLREAMGLFYQSYTLDATNYDALSEWIKLKVATYEKNFAIKYMRALLETEPQNAYLYWVMGELYSGNSEHRKAINFYHKSLDRDNRIAKVRMSLARSLTAIGELEAAINEYSLASRLDRRNGAGFFEAAQLLMTAKKYKLAEDMLKNLVAATPNYPGAHRLLSQVYQSNQKQDLAIGEMNKEVENNPQNIKFVIELAELYMGYNKYANAITTLSKVTNLPSEGKAPAYKLDRIKAFLLLSRCYRAQNRAESAEGAIRLALNIDQNDPELHKELGYVYHALQRDREGVKEFQLYLQRNPAARDAEAIRGLIKKMVIDD